MTRVLFLCCVISLLSVACATTQPAPVDVTAKVEPVTPSPDPLAAAASDAPPPKDLLSPAWIAYARRHPKGSALEHASLRDPAITSIAEAHKQADAVRADISARMTGDARWDQDLTTIKPLCDRLLDLVGSPEDYALCANHMYVLVDYDQRAAESLPYFRAALIDHPAPGPVYAQIATAYSVSDQPVEAMQALELAVDRGFNAFAWINTSHDLYAMREHANWPALRDRLLPKEVAYDTINVAGQIHEYMGRDSETYTLCANGRYTIEDREYGFWSVKDGALTLTTVHTCSWEWDEKTEEGKQVCGPPEKGNEDRPLLNRDEMLIAFTSAPTPTDEDGYERGLDYGFQPHTANIEPVFCTQPQPWDTRNPDSQNPDPNKTPKPDVDPNTVSTLR